MKKWSSLLIVSLLVMAVGCTSDEDGMPDGADASATQMEQAPGGAEEETVGAESGTLLDINESSDADLRAAGISDAAAAALATGRPFDDMLAVDAALANVLDEAGRESLYRIAWIPIDLNSASREEILLIPGVGERMAREFEEYRPYTAMAQFRREIGKYVDEAEVERLAQYVTIPASSM